MLHTGQKTYQGAVYTRNAPRRCNLLSFDEHHKVPLEVQMPATYLQYSQHTG